MAKSSRNFEGWRRGRRWKERTGVVLRGPVRRGFTLGQSNAGGWMVGGDVWVVEKVVNGRGGGVVGNVIYHRRERFVCK